MKRITSTNYQKDSLYRVVTRAVTELLKKGPVVTPVDLLLQLQRITKAQVEDWRFARIPYLERVTIGGLGKMSRLLRILDHHARAIGLKPSQTVYHKRGKGGKRIVLQFSKSGDPGLEAAYSRHYIAQLQPTDELTGASPHVVAEESCKSASDESESDEPARNGFSAT